MNHRFRPEPTLPSDSLDRRLQVAPHRPDGLVHRGVKRQRGGNPTALRTT